MKTQRPIPSLSRRAPAPLLLLLLLLAAALLGAACSERQGAAPAPQAPVAPAPAPAPAPAAQAAPAEPTAPGAPRRLATNVQGVAAAGLTVRVKAVEFTEDATLLDISASFGSRATNFTNLAETDTYLADPAGQRLMLKPPEDNRYLRIHAGDTMEGRLVFLGAVPPSATGVLRLVINDGHAGDDTSGPGLAIELPLKATGP